jgi:sulfane dehydrogenase subunit SoxC
MDETGYLQPSPDQLNQVRGLNGDANFASIYHMNGIMAWAVADDGSVSNAIHQV